MLDDFDQTRRLPIPEHQINEGDFVMWFTGDSNLFIEDHFLAHVNVGIAIATIFRPIPYNIQPAADQFTWFLAGYSGHPILNPPGGSIWVRTFTDQDVVINTSQEVMILRPDEGMNYSIHTFPGQEQPWVNTSRCFSINPVTGIVNSGSRFCPYPSVLQDRDALMEITLPSVARLVRTYRNEVRECWILNNIVNILMNDSPIINGKDDLNHLLAYFQKRDTLTSLACRDFFENQYNFDENDGNHGDDDDEDDDEGNDNEGNDDDNDDSNVW